ncbi:hypothetical protein [Microbacterium enclense]|uniref:Uncharacterized protein n=1 Tax=Microbacterium enclense TaxID=993073 RepID=A0A1G6HM38_9MICO|nr:hypothetical protein [Microbacterium enclense]SDB95320.1 hypothetical protein SAMN05216418_1341 [Microbacterium enclense]
MKARLFINRALDADRDFEESAFWAASALEMLGKSALSRVNPALIANAVDDDGASLLVASGLIDASKRFVTVQAKTVWSRCARAFRPFNGKEAGLIAEGRNEYIHGARVGFDAIPESAWWPRYWAQAEILLSHVERTVGDFVGPSREGAVETYLAANREHRQKRLEAALESARVGLRLFRTDNMSGRRLAEWNLFTLQQWEYSQPTECPACESELGEFGGEEVLDSRTEHYVDDDDFWTSVSVTLTVATAAFQCANCHLVIDDYELLQIVEGVPLEFEAEGDPADYEDYEEYNNE